ncbi:uncharacterized protein LOC119453877 isoform X8 [Dermacentor silvarum]|uniref:uncharacterized protein LOC119453877 isoform X8 n=1 Tax=Dermacentor silvarum TaxID=543639 RepID=UPI002101463B|nr:uncharacterized protein LOC119453877 isoform X8 [Dermacentor silvarum]
MERPTVKGLTNAMSLGESITAKTACHAPSEVVGQVEVGMQCSLPLADKSVGCSLKAWSVSRSMQTTEAVDQSSSTSGRHHDFSLTVKHKELQPNRHNHRDRCDYATTSLPALIILKRKHRGGERHRQDSICPRLASASEIPSLHSPITEPEDRVTDTPWALPSLFHFFFSFPRFAGLACELLHLSCFTQYMILHGQHKNT